MNNIDEDLKRTYRLLRLSSFNLVSQKMLSKIDDEFLRSRIVLFDRKFITIDDAKKMIQIYIDNLKKFNDLETETEKANFLISSLLVPEEIDKLVPEEIDKLVPEEIDKIQEMNFRNDVKRSLLKRINDPQIKKIIIQSMENYMDPKIKPYALMAQQMMREFFEDCGGKRFSRGKEGTI